MSILRQAQQEKRFYSWRGAIEQRRYGNRVRMTVCKDHKGKVYSSALAMCKAYGITLGILIDRLMKRVGLGTALTKSLKRKVSKFTPGYGAKAMVDHLGNEFTSKQALADYWGIPKSTLNTRLKKGMSLEEALTTPVKGRTVESKRPADLIISSLKQFVDGITDTATEVEDDQLALSKFDGIQYADSDGRLLAIAF